jgi:hypothetical protein
LAFFSWSAFVRVSFSANVYNIFGDDSNTPTFLFTQKLKTDKIPGMPECRIACLTASYLWQCWKNMGFGSRQGPVMDLCDHGRLKAFSGTIKVNFLTNRTSISLSRMILLHTDGWLV